MEPIILASARKHGVADEDMLHALRNAVAFYSLDDLTMVTGPDHTGDLIEVGVSVHESGLVFIVHAMRPARPQFLP